MTKAKIVSFLVSLLLACCAFGGSMLFEHEGRISSVETKSSLGHEMLKEIRKDIKLLLRGR